VSNKVVKHHGVHFLDKKQEKLILNSTNVNDILFLLGPPSTKSTFDTDIFIYIERKSTNKSIFKFGKEKIIVNNVLVLEINYKGLLVNKDFYDINKMNKLTFTEKNTEKTYSKKSFVYDFLSSMRQKINDPLGKRRK
tara:strand:- start:282 stop:692 length:411 start_codon:yes stop_codon:yes gene_type:complete